MSEDDDEWQYSIEDVSADEASSEAGSEQSHESGSGESEPDDEGDEETEDGGNVAGQIVGIEDDLEPGSPTLENALFVFLGALATILFFVSVAGLI